MRRISLYWSNICVLSRQESRHLEKAAAALAGRGIALDVHYFGLGRPQRLSERLNKDTEIPDIIVSTDLDFFEDAGAFSRIAGTLLPLREIVPLKKCVAQSAIGRNPLLLPFLVVPLVMVVNLAAWGAAPLPDSLADIADRAKAFGGRNNSAGKGLKRQLAELYGADFLRRFLASATEFELPVQAFQAVERGQAAAGVVPSLFARRADGAVLRQIYPKEGAPCVPSFVAVKNTLDERTAAEILAELLPLPFCDFFAANGDIFPCFDGAADTDLVLAGGGRFLY
jgi:hypothetical protein